MPGIGPGPGRGPLRPGPGVVALHAMANIPTDHPPPPPTDALVAVPPTTTSPESGEANAPQEAPAIAGLGKIEPSATPAAAATPKPARPKIIVPQRSCNGGLDFKFETDPYNVRLHDFMTSDEYTDAITVLNDMIRPSRSTKVDGVLLATGPLLVPLAVWGIRHSRQTKRRKKLLKEGIEDFNNHHANLYMRWNRAAAGSYLSIEPRQGEHGAVSGNNSTSPLLTGLEDSTVIV